MRTAEEEGERGFMWETSCLGPTADLDLSCKPAKLSRSSRILPNLEEKIQGEGGDVGEDRRNCACPCMHARTLLPDGVVESQVFLSELRLGAQRQVDLQVAVLHPLGGKVVLGLGQHGRERHALRHGLLMVAAEDTRLQMQERSHMNAVSKYSH